MLYAFVSTNQPPYKLLIQHWTLDKMCEWCQRWNKIYFISFHPSVSSIILRTGCWQTCVIHQSTGCCWTWAQSGCPRMSGVLQGTMEAVCWGLFPDRKHIPSHRQAPVSTADPSPSRVPEHRDATSTTRRESSFLIRWGFSSLYSASYDPRQLPAARASHCVVKSKQTQSTPQHKAKWKSSAFHTLLEFQSE